MIPGTSQKDDLLDLHTPTKKDPEIGEGALLLGMIAAGNATVLSVIQNGFAPVVAIPMTGKGDRSCDRGLLGISHGKSKIRYSATSK